MGESGSFRMIGSAFGADQKGDCRHRKGGTTMGPMPTFYSLLSSRARGVFGKGNDPWQIAQKKSGTRQKTVSEEGRWTEGIQDCSYRMARRDSL